MHLKTFQEQFQSFILESDETIIRCIAPSRLLSSEEKIRIYQNGYSERLIGAMQQDFPVLCALLGESAFSGLVCDYIDAYPSRDYNLRFVGKKLSDFIVEKDAALQAFSDLARFEYFLCDAEGKNEVAHFQSDFNVVEVWTVFYAEHRVIEFRVL